MLKINHRTEEKSHILVIKGEMDASYDQRLYDATIETIKAKKHVIVDMSDVRYFSSEGSTWLASLYRKLNQNNLKLIIIPSPMVCRILEVARLNQVLTIHNSIHEAKEELNQT